ncbi:hypothetical protein HDU91_003170 [Kappamyces sp. JEL0680]|nr:hypothetical protein HDU91_003170 [Kappamyces sp. JEL0680]
MPQSVGVYDVHLDKLLASWTAKAAVLGVVWSGDEKSLVSGGLDRSVSRFAGAVFLDHSFVIDTQMVTTLGKHEAAVSCLATGGDAKDQIISGSWDKTVKLWDARAEKALQATLAVHDKVFSIDACGHMLVVALAGRVMELYDLRQTKEPWQTRDSSLKHMTRQVRCIPTGSGYATSSIEGRVAVDYFDAAPEIQSQKFSFKCHRQKQGEQEIIFPVNALAYHPVDGSQKKRLRQFPSYPTSISSLSFSKDGSLLAIASSYTYEEGEKDHPVDSIHIRPISESDVLPKSKAK